MKKLLFIIVILASTTAAFSQKFFTRTGSINFHSNTPLEDIDANSSQATSVIDMETGDVAWAVLMKSFQFKKALMQEHFNENYIESSKYPKGTFKGKIINYNPSTIKQPGTHNVEVEGELNMHGVTKTFKTKGVVDVKAEDVLMKTSFKIAPEDYNITIPQLVRDKIAKVIDVKVEALCQPLKK